MKKLLSLILAGTMVLSLSAPAFAEEAGNTHKLTANKASHNKASIDVKGTYLTELKSDEIISVVVAWDDMNFIYYSSQEGTWQPLDHIYAGDKGETWNKTTSDITVTNHSNVAVTANLSYTQSVSTVKGNLSNESLNLESAAQDEYMGENASKAPTKKSTFTIDGNMEEDSSKDLGTITVSLSKDDGIEWTRVSTFDELSQALNSGGNVKLANDITAANSVLYKDSAFNLDLNGKTLNIKQLRSTNNQAVFSISNGKIITEDECPAVVAYCKELTIDNCTLTTKGDYYALYIESGVVTVKNTFLNDGVCVDGGTLYATENVTINRKISVIDVDLGKSKATFGFDPTNAWVGFKYDSKYLKDNGDGTWTIAL